MVIGYIGCYNECRNLVFLFEDFIKTLHIFTVWTIFIFIKKRKLKKSLTIKFYN